MALYGRGDWSRLVADVGRLLDQAFENSELVSVLGALLEHTSWSISDKSGKSGYSGARVSAW